MSYSVTVQIWLNRVRHDLVKRVLWNARDHQAMGQVPLPGRLITQCINDEGQPISPEQCWQNLKLDAPDGLDLLTFENALTHSLSAAMQDDLEGVLALDAAFERLSTKAE